MGQPALLAVGTIILVAYCAAAALIALALWRGAREIDRRESERPPADPGAESRLESMRRRNGQSLTQSAASKSRRFRRL